MTPKEIIAADAAKNHKDIPLEKHIERIGGVLANGGQIVQQGNTLFMFKADKKGSVEFHTYNADPADQYLENIRTFFRMLKKIGAKMAHTQYKNPKLSDIARALAPEFKSKITKNGMYTLQVRLQ